jgi:CheY-like chemotaxis protein
MNLIVNAFDAMPQGGKLDISTTQRHVDVLLCGYKKVEPGEYVLLRIRDTGMGIDAADLDKIFEPYYSKKKLGTSGSGLGLSVVYGILRDHKGYYDILSQPGNGSEFILYFPTTKERCVEEDEESTSAGGSETVLIVDDTPEQRDIASEFLTILGYRVQTAVHGHAALDYLREHDADLILMDMIMENGFDGLDTYREIVKRRPGQRALIVSGFSATERVEEMQRLGAGAYIKKPYTLDTIARAVRDELDRPETVPSG